MKEIKLTKEIINAAQKRVDEIGEINNSFMNNKRTLFGFIGEEIFQLCYPAAERFNTYDFDFILKDKKIDVKTNSSICKPKPNYEFSIHKRVKDQDVDFYYFITVLKDLSCAYIVGYISKDDFNKMPWVEKGDKTLGGNYEYRAPAKRILISEIRNIL